MTSFLNFRSITVESYARQSYHRQKERISCFTYDTGTTRATYRYQVLVYSSNSNYCLYCCRCSLQQVPRSYCTKKVTPFESSHGHHLCARSSRTLFRPQARGDGIRMQSLLGESRASCRLSCWVGLNSVRLTATAVRGGRRQLLTIAHIHRVFRPRCRTESSWLRAGRVWACTRPLRSVHAAAELVCRRRDVLVRVSRVQLL